MKKFNESKREEKIAKYKCLIKQAEDRKTKTVSKGEKQFLERQIEKLSGELRGLK